MLSHFENPQQILPLTLLAPRELLAHVSLFHPQPFAEFVTPPCSRKWDASFFGDLALGFGNP